MKYLSKKLKLNKNPYFYEFHKKKQLFKDLFLIFNGFEVQSNKSEKKFEYLGKKEIFEKPISPKLIEIHIKGKK